MCFVKCYNYYSIREPWDAYATNESKRLIVIVVRRDAADKTAGS